MLLREICRLPSIEKTRTTPYHPQSDGFVEQFNHTLLNMFNIMATENDWDLQLPTAMVVYHTSIHETTKTTSFSLIFGHKARLPVDVVYSSPPEETISVSKQICTKATRQTNRCLQLGSKEHRCEAENTV